MLVMLSAPARAGESPPPTQITPADRTLVMQQLGPDMSDVDPAKDLDIAKTDLNADGRPDYIVVLKSSLYCGSGGCSVFVYLSSHDGNYRAALPELLAGSITPGTASTQGVRDLVVTGRTGTKRWVWNGKVYGPATAAAPSASQKP